MGDVTKQVVFKIAIGLAVAVLVFAAWRFGVWADSLMTVRTPLYYQIHGWASAVVAPLAGVFAGFLYDPMP